jgi:hypothetical protein
VNASLVIFSVTARASNAVVSDLLASSAIRAFARRPALGARCTRN